MNKPQADNPLQRIKDEIRVEAVVARARASAIPAIAPERAVTVATAASSIGSEVSLLELCGFHSVGFVERAFIALLGRPADADSIQAQMALLGAGRSKIEILGNLRWSPEGRARAVNVPGLLPRYLLVKLGSLPVIGHLVESAIALASVASIARHQRAADSFHYARVEAVDQQTRNLLSQIETLGEANEQLRRENQALATELAATRERFEPMQASIDATSAIVDDSRQRVLSVNHWLASLRHHLATLELTQAADDRAADAANAEITRLTLDQDTARGERLDAWADALARMLPAHTEILDLGSGDEWIGRLRARGVPANPGVARSMGSHAEIVDALARSADDSVSGVTVLDVAPLLRHLSMTRLLAAISRILQPQGRLMIGLDQGPLTLVDRLQGRADVALDARLLTASLRGAGFADIETLTRQGVICLVARCPVSSG